MEPTKKAVQDALKFIANAVNDPEIPPETRRKCADMILSRDCTGSKDTTPAPAPTVTVTYQVIE